MWKDDSWYTGSSLSFFFSLSLSAVRYCYDFCCALCDKLNCWTQGISALHIFIKAFALKNFLTDCKNHVSISTLSIKIILSNSLALSWRRPYSCRNQSTDSLRNSMDWFLYDDGFRHERVKSLNQVVISHLYIFFA